ncbi:MAG: family 16 glycosylhydrolase [Chitinophagales bacterium]|nr:family 16 glycosylhydrolase [Chitinophagales bacterium]
MTIISVKGFSQNYILWWEDEFDGNSVNTSNWSLETGDGCPSLCGWGNNELEWYQPQNAEVNNGRLIITAKEESVGGKDYTSARMKSKSKVEFTYGKVEARIKMPTGQGMWPAFWMLFADPVNGGWPMDGEIDIVELVGHDNDKIYGTIHYGAAWPNNKQYGGSYKLASGTFASSFHTFSVIWDSSKIRWFVDSTLYFTADHADVFPYDWPFNKDFYILLNCAVGGDWPGSPNASTVFPQTMEVKWVRVYKKANMVSVPTIDGPDPVKVDLSSNPMGGSGRIYVESNVNRSATIQITDINGRVIFNHSVQLDSGSWHSLDMENVTPGAYLLTLTGSDFTWTEKIIRK